MYLLSLTVRHGLGDDFKAIRTGVATAWRNVQSGAPWTRFKDRVRFRGSIRALEVTHGPNGFHPHLHTLILLDRPLGNKELREARSFLSLRWQHAVSRKLADSAVPDTAHGCDLRPSHASQYISKLGLSFELTSPVGKFGRAGNRSLLQVAADFTATGDDADAHIWRVYSDGIRGARMLTWTIGLRTEAGLTEDMSDEEALHAADLSEETVAVIPGQLWKRVCSIRDAVCRLLEAAEEDGPLGVQEVLTMMTGVCCVSFPTRSG